MKEQKKISDKTIPQGTKIRYYVIPDERNGFPRITVCVIKIGNVYCRGISICSLSEREDGCGYIQWVGEDQARHSAMKAWNYQENVDPIIRPEAIHIIKKTMIDPDEPIDKMFGFKGSYNTRLTEYEDTFIFC